MSEKVYVLNVYNTMTGQYELIQVTKEVFQTYRRTKWNIEDSTERFFKHETQSDIAEMQSCKNPSQLTASKRSGKRTPVKLQCTMFRITIQPSSTE